MQQACQVQHVLYCTHTSTSTDGKLPGFWMKRIIKLTGLLGVGRWAYAARAAQRIIVESAEPIIPFTS